MLVGTLSAGWNMGFILTDIPGAVGTDTLVDVERLKFSDRGIALDTGATQFAGQAQLLLGAAQGNFLWHLAESAANQTQVGLVGLATTGLEFGP